MSKEIVANKLRLPSKGLWEVVVDRIRSCEKFEGEIIPFKKIFSKLGGSFQISRHGIWEILYFLNDLGFIEIVPFHGIKIIWRRENATESSD